MCWFNLGMPLQNALEQFKQHLQLRFGKIRVKAYSAGFLLSSFRWNRFLGLAAIGLIDQLYTNGYIIKCCFSGPVT